MNSVPKKRTSQSRSAMRRSHDALVAQYAVACPSCGEYMQRHRACPSCGKYRGRQAIQVKSAKA